jgi:PAS domain S-box-containing protein
VVAGSQALNEPVRSRSRRGWPLGAYAGALLVVFIAAALGSALYVRVQAENDHHRNAQADAQFVADLAAREIAAALTQIETTVTRTAASPAIAAVLAPGASCNLTVGPAGVFQQTRLDIVGQDGTVICSSAGTAAVGTTYRGASWFGEAQRGATFAAPIADTVTTRPSLVSAAPVAGKGVLAAFADLVDVGPTLGERFGRSGEFEILVTTADGATALTRSIDAGKWSGASLEGSTFAANLGESVRPDPDGRKRLYGEAESGRGWRVYAGADQAAASTFATTLFFQQIGATAIGLVVVLIGMLIAYRTVVNPIGRLSRSVAGGASLDARPVPVGGPSEVAALGEAFNGMIATVHSELAERRRAEDQVRGMIDAALDAVVGMDQNGEVIEWSRQAEATFGWTKAEVVGKPLVELIIPERYRSAHRAGLERYRRTGTGAVIGKRLELEAVARDGREFPIELSITEVASPVGTVFSAFIRDISERVAAARQRTALETQLQQAQRLESVGQLAGGIAHDFNNLIAVILNYATFVSDELGDRPEIKEDVEEIKKAAERAAGLTRQLLIFSRREVARPEVLDLTAVVADMRKLLQRTIGEHIDLRTNVESGLWLIHADRGQIEQVVMNLAVNARDAMPQGGRLVMDVANVKLDEDFAAGHLNLKAGRYVRLTLADSGHGMTADVKDRAFEPFFTTKPKGQGTGLGLATVYGIVTQAGGTVSLYSEPGRGTTARVLIPAVEAEAMLSGSARVDEDLRGHGETVVLVEDEAAVRAAAQRILVEHGYVVLEAATASAAIGIATDRSRPLDLILTDVVMPEMSGIELAERIRRLRPVRVLFMSGHPQEVVAHGAALAADAHLLEKPFTRDGLLRVIRDALASD